MPLPDRKRIGSCLFLMAAALASAGLIRQAKIVTRPELQVFRITLRAGNYEIAKDRQGRAHIQMQADYGTAALAGEPELPGRTFFIALPPGARVESVHFDVPQVRRLPGSFQIAPVPPVIYGPQDSGRAWARWEERRREVYSSDAVFPAEAALYLGQTQWRRYTCAQVALQPFSYQPRDGILSFYPEVEVTIEYLRSEAGSDAGHEAERLRHDRVLDDLISRQVVNFDQALGWYESTERNPPLETSLYDYVIIVQNDTIAAAMAPLKTWKETLGHHVQVTTLATIHSQYSGVDAAEEVWNFLHDKYPSSQWGIRYVLIVGDLRILVNRRLYYSNPPGEWGLPSDHFFAKLSGGSTSAQVWNRDGDLRWGEIDADEMSVVPDVLVGRLPLNTTTEIANAVQAMVAFEQNTDSWKHRALLAGGYNDISSSGKKTDNAVPLEYIRNNLLIPNGWSATRIYEQSGLGTSTYSPAPDYDTSQANVVAALNAEDHGIALLTDHGDSSGLSGHIWHHDTANTGTVDPGEWVWSDLFLMSDVASLTNTHTPIFELIGCATLALTTAPWPLTTMDSAGNPMTPGGFTTNTGTALLAAGRAAGVVGFDSPVPYSSYWASPANTSGEQTLAVYFNENLVQNRYTLGWSLYEAKIRYKSNFYKAGSYQPIPWSFELFGDPAMILEGYDRSALGTNKIVHTGAVYSYGTDNDDNGDMYVAASTRPIDQDGQIKVYKSSDHGSTWQLWSTVNHSAGIRALDVLVSRWKQDEFGSSTLHVFFTDTAGLVNDMRIALANPATQSRVVVFSEGAGVNLSHLGAARDPMAMPSALYLYLTWSVPQGDSHLVRVGRSAVDGVAWDIVYSSGGYSQPKIDAGPDQRVYLAAVADGYPNDVHVNRSLDRGNSWGLWTNLSTGDSAVYHAVPVPAASTDSAFPTVWVAYNSYEQVVLGGTDVRYAFSTDGGTRWTTNRILSAEKKVDELMPDMVGHRSGASRWMNVAYDYSRASQNNILWRWGTGSVPGSWWAPRLMNDYPTQVAIGPQVIYSPGVAGTGSGVVYPGTGSPIANLYFAAPWLTAAHFPARSVSRSTAPRAAGAASKNGAGESDVPKKEAQTDQNSLSAWPAWDALGSAGAAFRVAALARRADGVLFAAATTRQVNEANTAAVFRSSDGGATWQPSAPLPQGWWLEDLLLTSQGSLLAGGLKCEGIGQCRGAVYRSADAGDHWNIAGEWQGTSAIQVLLQRTAGELIAAGGPGGAMFRSSDDGQHWLGFPAPPGGEEVRALWESPAQVLFAAGRQAGAHGFVSRFSSGSWSAATTLPGVSAINAMTGSGNLLVAGGAGEAGTAMAFRSTNGGDGWSPLPAPARGRAIRSLLQTPLGQVIAGVEMGEGLFTSYVFYLAPGSDLWQEAGFLYKADTVYDLLPASQDRIYAATGDTYGSIQNSRLPVPILYIPMIHRAAEQ